MAIENYQKALSIKSSESDLQKKAEADRAVLIETAVKEVLKQAEDLQDKKNYIESIKLVIKLYKLPLNATQQNNLLLFKDILFAKATKQAKAFLDEGRYYEFVEIFKSTNSLPLNQEQKKQMESLTEKFIKTIVDEVKKREFIKMLFGN